MREVFIAIFIGAIFAFAGWGWHMSHRWVRLMFRTLTFECVLATIWILTWNWVWQYHLMTIPIVVAIGIPLLFFREIIPFPIIQFFRTDNITTNRIERKPKHTEFGIGYRRDMKREPDSFIFPYIQEVSISPIVNNSRYLGVRCCLPSALPYHLNLKIIYIKLSISGIEIKKLKARKTVMGRLIE